jgi:hypothetical protein
MSEPPILDETMIEHKDFSQDQHKIENQDNPISHKRPIDNQVNLATPPKAKNVYKGKEKVVEQPRRASSFLPSQEEKKSIVDQPAPTQTQLDNKTKRKINTRENR